MYYKIFKKTTAMVVALVMVVGAFFCMPEYSYARDADTGQNGKDLAQLTPTEAGLVLIGKDVKGNCGFGNDILFVSEDDIEKIKVSKNTAEFGLGDSWVENGVFSSYDNHGSGNYHYSNVKGIDIAKMMNDTVENSADITNYYVMAKDGYTQNTTVSTLSGLKYYAPGDSVGIPSLSPIIALYKTTNSYEETKDPLSMLVPASSVKTDRGDNVFMFGQTDPKDSNNCKFLHGATVVTVQDIPEGIKSKSRNKSEGLAAMMLLGKYETSYSFIKKGEVVTHNVAGVPLSKVLEDMNLSSLLDEFPGAKIRARSLDGMTSTLTKAETERSFVAYDYTDDMETPEKQMGKFALYMPGETGPDAVLYSLAELNVIDESGSTICDLAAPAGFTATATGYSSVKLSWNKVPAANGYFVYRATSKNGDYKLVKTISSENTLTCIDTGLTTNRTYYYKVSGYKVKDDTKMSGQITSVKSATPYLKKPVVKLSKSGSIKYGKGAVKISWSKVSGASGYQVYRYSSKYKKYVKIKTVTKGSVLSYTNKGLKKGSKYYYKVRAYRTVSGSNKYSGFSATKSIRR